MSRQLWPAVLFVCELAGLAAMSELVGKRKLWYGWLVLAAAMSLPWLIYSITDGPRYGFVALSLLWATIYLRNAYRWKRANGHSYDAAP